MFKKYRDSYLDVHSVKMVKWYVFETNIMNSHNLICYICTYLFTYVYIVYIHISYWIYMDATGYCFPWLKLEKPWIPSSGSWPKQLKTAVVFPNGMENLWCDGNQDFLEIPGKFQAQSMVFVSWNLVFPRSIHDLALKMNRSTAWHEKPHFLLGVYYPLVMTNIAIENGPFIVNFPIKNGDIP